MDVAGGRALPGDDGPPADLFVREDRAAEGRNTLAKAFALWQEESRRSCGLLGRIVGGRPSFANC